LSLLALLRVCHLVGRELSERWKRAVPPLLIALGLFLAALELEPVTATLDFGQINLIIMWLITEDVLRRKGNRAGGALLGIATGIKLIPGLFIVLLALTRRVREAVIALAATAMTVAAGFLFQPDQAWRYWTGIAYDPSRVGGVAFISNQSLNGVITRFTQPGGSRPVWILLSVVTLAVCLWGARRLWMHEMRLLSLAVVATATLLISPISWSHHWVWLIVVLAALLDPSTGPRAVRWVMLGTFYALGTSRIIWQVPNTNDLEYLHTTWQRLVGNAYCWMAVAFVILTTVTAARLPRPARDNTDRAADGSGADEDLREPDERGALLAE
jgi:alpha-1,2-mannosyltransferase